MQGDRKDKIPAPSAPISEIEDPTAFPALVDTCEFVYMYHKMIRTLQKSFVMTLAVLVLSLSGLTLARASELVMFERDGCVWCQRWDRTIAPIYAKTDEARLLPLRRVDIDRQSADGIILAAPVRFTPTFVVVDQGREVGRITGYANDESFWGLLAMFAAKIDPLYRAPNRT